MLVLASVEQKPFNAVFIIYLDHKLQYVSHDIILEGKDIFGLCQYKKLVAGVSCNSKDGCMISIFNPYNKTIDNFYKARPTLDRRYIYYTNKIWGDIHEIKYYNDYFVIVNTASDSLVVLKTDNSYSYSVNLYDFAISLNLKGAIYGRHSHESNYYHFNSLYIDKDEQTFYVMAHNTRSIDKSFIIKGDIILNKQKEPLFIPNSAILNLSTENNANSGKQCHDLLKIDKHIFYSESVNSCISYINVSNGKKRIFFQDNKFGFVRGLSKYKNYLFIGSSDYRKASGKFQDKTLILNKPVYIPAIVILDTDTLKIVSIINFNSITKYNEIEVRNILVLK